MHNEMYCLLLGLENAQCLSRRVSMSDTSSSVSEVFISEYFPACLAPNPLDINSDVFIFCFQKEKEGVY